MTVQSLVLMWQFPELTFTYRIENIMSKTFFLKQEKLPFAEEKFKAPKRTEEPRFKAVVMLLICFRKLILCFYCGNEITMIKHDCLYNFSPRENLSLHSRN